MVALMNKNDDGLEEALQELLSKYVDNPDFKLSELSTDSAKTLGISDSYSSKKSFRRILVNLNCDDIYSKLLNYWVAELSIKLCSTTVRDSLIAISKECKRTGVFNIDHETMSSLQAYYIESNRDMFPVWINKIKNIACDDLKSEFQLFNSKIHQYLDIIKLKDIIDDIREDLDVVSYGDEYQFTERCFAIGVNELVSDFLVDDSETIKLPARELTYKMVEEIRLGFLESGPSAIKKEAVKLIESAYKLRQLEKVMRL